jgi:hypothetical protein
MKHDRSALLDEAREDEQPKQPVHLTGAVPTAAPTAQPPDDFPDDEAKCPACDGDGGDKWNDYCLPCGTCGGDGRLW